MRKVIALLFLASLAFGQYIPAGGGGGGSSVTIAGTSRKITVAGAGCAAATGTCTLTLPADLLLPLSTAFTAATTSGPSFNVPAGVAPTSPASGDFWNLSGVLQLYDGSATRSLLTDNSSLAWAKVTGAPTFAANTTATGSQWFTAYNSTTGAFTKAQPAFSDISGTASAAQLPIVTTQSQGNNSTSPASTAYTDLAVANAIAGVNPAVAVQAASAAVLPNSPTYLNGVAGIGATLTTATTNTALVVDGYTMMLNDRVLVKTQASAFQNGVYFLSTIQSLGIAWILTRALDYDQPSDMNNTGAIPVVNGTVNAQTQWVQTSQVTTVGTDAVTYTQFSIKPSTILTTSSPATPVYTTTTYSATPTFTVSISSIQHFIITLTGNVTSSTLSTGSAATGQDISFNICQDGTGARTFVPPANVVGMSTINPAASACSRQLFRWDGTNAIAMGPMISVASGNLTMNSPTVIGPIFGGLPLSNVKAISYQAAAIAVGDTDMYTVPAGRVALLDSVGIFNNACGGSVGMFAELKIGSTYYRIDTTNNASNNNKAIDPSLGFMAVAGQTFAVNVDTDVCATTGSIQSVPIIPWTMAAGDSISLNTDSNSALQFAWTLLLEMPTPWQ